MSPTRGPPLDLRASQVAIGLSLLVDVLPVRANHGCLQHLNSSPIRISHSGALVTHHSTRLALKLMTQFLGQYPLTPACKILFPAYAHGDTTNSFQTYHQVSFSTFQPSVSAS